MDKPLQFRCVFNGTPDQFTEQARAFSLRGRFALSAAGGVVRFCAPGAAVRTIKLFDGTPFGVEADREGKCIAHFARGRQDGSLRARQSRGLAGAGTVLAAIL